VSFKRGSTATGIHAHNINHNIIVLKRILLSLMQKYALLYRYNALFGFLINIRQVQVMLQHCWASQMMHKGSEKHLTPVWQLRSHMAFFIDNIQYYVHVDVIESQFSLLLESIHSTHDFETIQQAHCSFISSLFRQLFLQTPSVSAKLINCGVPHAPSKIK